MTYNEATALVDEFVKRSGRERGLGEPERVEIDENDDTVFIDGWVSFENLKWLAAQLPAGEADNNLTTEVSDDEA